jgi:hypothetical protein
MASGTVSIQFLQEWAPEQMDPGTMFNLDEQIENRGFPKNPFVAVFSCPRCGTHGLITYRQAVGVDFMICGSDDCSAEYRFKMEGEGEAAEYYIEYRRSQ